MPPFYRRLHQRQLFSLLGRPKTLFGPADSRPRTIASVYQAPSKAVIPERLLVYHAGTGKIVFVGSLKVTTIFLFSATAIFISPNLYNDPEQPIWVAPTAIAASAVPLIYVMYYASPFVAYVHLKLPVFARRSREQLLKWAENIPPNTEVEITTIKSYGSLRITRMPISELQPVKAKFGIENLKRVPKTASSMTRPWWAPKERHMFFIDTTQRRKTVEAAVWQKAREQINNS